MCCLCCRCELCSLKRRTINSTTPCVLASSPKLRIFPSHPILDLCSLTVKAQWDRPAAYCPAHPLIPSSPPSLLHASSITQIQMFDCRLYLTFGMSLYFHISPVTSSRIFIMLSPIPLPHHHTIILHFRSLSNPTSPSFTFYPPPPPPPAPHSFDLLE